MKIHNGWLIDNADPYGARRINLQYVAEYAYSVGSEHTYVWVQGRSLPAEIPGDHVELIDSFFASKAAK